MEKQPQLEEAKLEKKFVEYQMTLLNWNEAIKVKNNIMKDFPDSKANRIILSDAHDVLKEAYRNLKEARKIVDVAILEQHNIQQHWRNL